MSFKERFEKAEATFISALTTGPGALAEFDTEWGNLQAEFKNAVENSLVDAEAADIAYTVSSRIAILGDSVLDLEETTTSLTADLLADIDNALSALTIQDVANTPPAHRRATQYIPDAFAWLQRHVHDPYPSSSLKRVWARNAHLSVRSMDDWFKSVRKEIGWVTLTKAHFNGSRSLAVQGASAVLLDSGDDVAVPFEVQTELFAIKARLDNLFLEERALAARPPTRTTHKRSRSTSVSSSTTDITVPSRPISLLEQSDSPSDDTSTASSSPSSRASSRLPSLVFDQSDSEEDEQFPEVSIPGLLDDAAMRVTDLVKDDDMPERQLKRSRHSYYDLSVGDSPPSWPIDPFAQLIDTQFILPNDLAPNPDFWSFPMEEKSLTETATTALIGVIPTVDRVSTSPKTVTSTSRKRHHEDAELEGPASKKSRTIRSLPRSNPRKEQKAPGTTPVLVANAPPPVEEPIVIDWEQLLKDLEEATSNTGGGSFDVTGPVDCNVFDFAALEPTSTSPSNIDDSWDKLFSADVFGSNSAPTDEELFASFTNVDALAGPDFPASADVSTVSIELPLALSSDLGLGTELASEFPAYELSSSSTSPFAQAGQPEVSSLCSGSDNTTQLAIPDSAEASPSIFDVLSRLDSGGSFDTYSPPLVAFS